METSHPGCSIKFTTAQVPIEFTSGSFGTFPYSAIPPTFTLFSLYEQDKTTQKLQELWVLSDKTTEAVSVKLPCHGLAAGLLHPQGPVSSRTLNYFAMLWKTALSLAYKLLPKLLFNCLMPIVCGFRRLVMQRFSQAAPKVRKAANLGLS